MEERRSVTVRIIKILGRLWLFGLTAWTLGLILSIGDAGTVWTFAYLIVLWDLMAALGLLVIVKIMNIRSL